MIEVVVLNYLKSKITDIPVVMEVVNYPKFILIEKTGSSISNYVKSSTFAIQSYSDSLYDAALLNETLKEVMLGDGLNKAGIIELDEINSCDMNSDYNYTDTTTKNYRYQAVFNLVHY